MMFSLLGISLYSLVAEASAALLSTIEHFDGTPTLILHNM